VDVDEFYLEEGSWERHVGTTKTRSARFSWWSVLGRGCSTFFLPPLSNPRVPYFKGFPSDSGTFISSRQTFEELLVISVRPQVLVLERKGRVLLPSSTTNTKGCCGFL